MALFRKRNVDPWQLGPRAALGLLALAITLVLLPVAAVWAHLLHVIGTVGLAGWTLARFLVYLGNVLVAASGVGSYAYVSCKAPRPRILHTYGRLLILQLAYSSARPLLLILEQTESNVGYMLCNAAGQAAVYVLWGANRAIFLKAVTGKLMVLGRLACRCQDVQLWGKALTVAILTSSLCGSAAWMLVASNLLQGVPLEGIFAAVSFSPRLADGSEVSVADRVAFSVAINLGGLASGLALAGASFYMFIAWRLIRGVIVALAVRGTPPEVLTKVRGTLLQHMLGIVLSLSTTMLVILAAMANGLNLLGQQEAEQLASLAANTLDTVADVGGVLLLSGIGALLLREDPKAADINRSIRSLLHSAVLRGQAQVAFEGQVIPTASRRCIVSFPGRFSEEWKDMTWQSERHELSTACVFLPESDPHQRFGKHSPCPETPGACWCTPLYGEVKPWGCSWFPVWEANVQRAVDLGLELVVVFFPGQVGQGLVDWSSLAHVDLWDGCGLGGSQKCEAAYLHNRGISFTSEDLDDVRSCLASKL